MNLVVDVSVVIKWFVRENLYAEADSLLGGEHVLHAPDFIITELANVAWKKAIRDEIDVSQASEIVQGCRDNVPILHSSLDLAARALQIGLDIRHPVYDCLYLACAETLDGFLVTADSRLLSTLKNTQFSALAVPLDDSRFRITSLRIAEDKINQIIELSKLMQATRNNVYDALHSKGKLSIVNMQDMAPYFSSPSLRRMYEFIESLTEAERIDLLALMWLGQEYSDDDWQAIRDRASKMIGSYANQRYTYLVGLTNYLEQGLKQFHDVKRDKV